MAAILIVEDEALVAIELERLVLKADHQIFGSVAKAERAFDLLAKGRPDAALLDVRLAGGALVYPVADALAALGVPFAFMTAYPMRAINPRFAGRLVLHKPFAAADVLAAIKRLLYGDMGVVIRRRDRAIRGEHPTAPNPRGRTRTPPGAE
jgi:two-component SAPR family response regulator